MSEEAEPEERNKLFTVGFGMLPLWYFLFTAIVGGDDFFAVIGWVLIWILPQCLLTYGIVRFTYYARWLAGDNESKKNLYGVVSFVVATVLIGGFPAYLWWDHRMEKVHIKAQVKAAEEFVKHDARLNALIPGQRVSVDFRSAGNPWSHNFPFIIFDANRSSKYRGVLQETSADEIGKFRLLCMISEQDRQRRSQDEWCPASKKPRDNARLVR